MNSLHDVLGVKPEPEFSLQLPPGWERFDVSEATEKTFLDGVEARMRELGRPDVQAMLQNSLRSNFAQMRESRVVALFAPAGDEESTLYIPASLIAAIRTASHGGNLDQVVRDAIETKGALPLFGDARILVFETTRPQTSVDGTIIVHSRQYLMPVPGTKRRRGLQFTAGWGRPETSTVGAALDQRYRELFDACVSTIRWT